MTILLWAAYLGAVILTVMVKLLFYMHNVKPEEATFKNALYSYFVGDKATNVTSISVLGFELLLGAVVCDRLTVFGEYLTSLPQHWALSFFLGSLAEGLAPLGIGAISKRIFP